MVFFFSGLVNVLMLTGSVYMLQVYDRVLTSGSIVTLVGLFSIVIILYLFLGLFDFLRQRLLSRIAIRLDLNLGRPSFRALISSGDTNPDVSAEPLRQLGIVRQFLSSPAAISIFDLPFVPIFLSVMFLIHAWLGVMVLAGAVVAGLIALLGRAWTRKWQEKASLQNEVLQEFSQLSGKSAETITAMGMQKDVAAQWKRLQENGLALHQRASNPSELLASVSKTFRLLLQSSILTVGAVLVLQDQISAGMIIASSILSGRALAPIDQVIGQWWVVGRAVRAHGVLRMFFAQDGLKSAKIELPLPKGHVLVKSLLKHAPLQSKTVQNPLLHDVSFALDPGDGLGVIGKSAAGKSTLARLLVGAWQPDRGEIQLDGASHDQRQLSAIGRSIGYLPQKLELLPGTIAQNIARFRPDAADADVIAAAQLAGVHELIMSLPDGYASRIAGAAGTPLSGGQIQRIGLARAVLFRPAFVVLDEPNAHLDGAGDDALENMIRKLRDNGSTVVVMAHRPSAVSAMNKIMILDHGRVVRFDLKEAVLGSSEPTASSSETAATKGQKGTHPRTSPQIQNGFRGATRRPHSSSP